MEGMLADDRTRVWARRAALREKERLEQRARDTRRADLADQEREDEDSQFLSVATEVALAVEERIRNLNERLDALDRASLQALMEAQERLDDVRRNANHARDGRLVFEAEDGTIYDEQGSEVHRDEIYRSTWRDDGSRWEQYQERAAHVDQIAAYRERIQEQRERLHQGADDDELDEFEREFAELEADMPPSIKDRYELTEHSSERTASRSTSMAKTLDGAHESTSMLRAPFLAATTGAMTETADEHPGVTFNPATLTPP